MAAVHELAGERLLRQKRYDEAAARYKRAIALTEEDSPESAWVGYSMAGLARVYREAGRIDEALGTYRRAIELMREGWGEDDVDYLRAAQELAELEERAAAD
jgi:tetratricopeptide (TPR) repeat protein